MKLSGSIILIGPMGAGKSTIGRLLSERLKCTFIDLDRAIEERAGVDIPWIFDVEGESGFRERESQVLDELLHEPPCVIATGGGAVLRRENRERLAEGGTVVYLQASVDQQLQRTAKDKGRPLLQTADPRATLTALARERAPLYQETAHITLETDRRTPKEIVRSLVDRFTLED